MNNKDFQKWMNKTTSHHAEYLAALAVIEEEYKNRYGNYPGDVDDDFFIDSFSQTTSGATVKEVEENALLHKKVSW